MKFWPAFFSARRCSGSWRPRRKPKNLAWRLLELVLLWGITLCIGFALEARLGQIQHPHWEFFAGFGFLFLTLAFPGFVWRYLMKHR